MVIADTAIFLSSTAALCLVCTRGAICIGSMRGTATLLSGRKSSPLFLFLVN